MRKGGSLYNRGMRSPEHRVAGLACGALLWVAACSQGANGTSGLTPTTATASSSSGQTAGPATATATGTDGSSGTTGTSGATTAGSAGASGSTGPKFDSDPGTSGCTAVDLLFVVDNSDSMGTYQQALTQAFPGFAQAMFDALPAGLSVHVGITTTDFDTACTEQEGTNNCQSTASADTILMHYIKPTDFNDGGNGSQGRLFEFAGKRYFETTTDDDPADLVTWFSGAATSAGENGCSFEMPVAAAGWAVHPANTEGPTAPNMGFLRDEGALLVVFFLTDEPDKSPESKNVYRDMLLDAKAGCGGLDCIFVAGLIPPCVIDVNQKLWQFMTLFDDNPPWSSITDTSNYTDLVGTALAHAVAEACAAVPVG